MAERGHVFAEPLCVIGPSRFPKRQKGKQKDRDNDVICETTTTTQQPKKVVPPWLSSSSVLEGTDPYAVGMFLFVCLFVG
jgi:hypothetical protein